MQFSDVWIKTKTGGKDGVGGLNDRIDTQLEEEEDEEEERDEGESLMRKGKKSPLSAGQPPACRLPCVCVCVCVGLDVEQKWLHAHSYFIQRDFFARLLGANHGGQRC